MNKYQLFPRCLQREKLKIQSQPLLVEIQKHRDITQGDIDNARVEEEISPDGLRKPALIISSINNLPGDKFDIDIMLLEKEKIRRAAMNVEGILKILPDKSDEDYHYWLNKLMHEMYTLGSKVQEHNDFIEHLYALKATEKHSRDRVSSGSSSPKAYQPYITLIKQVVEDIQKHPYMSRVSRLKLADAIDELLIENTISPPSHKSIKKYIAEAYACPGKRGNKSRTGPSLNELKKWISDNYKNKIITKSDC
ncbi:hypothetical protein [Pseudoalteromonas ruthenica]|uniref:Uncharacterized protein n=1 Tax=Pseudoalteromonas ruthenica TaxID=151081 RepID=A0A0F4PLY1_9GAMM|nr:hypothetical protein [Pseudoalteromonas ruthenica]KJY93932.1 hypothetical protein TW76_18595 [Pseudoalteromonas ruthenica]KJY96422.1 hypothetical protein TW72_16925 [Pseudoalteromonas ruthenica]TMO94590.1 hypothetical protein CWC13_00030 [Pseudoalteromonas ruthenica]TMO97251.1 hypothetical protein CWC07_14800 [Pseudoalteromonas ruthenica]TMP09205.1 hypothetical protein CWC09_07750 [Pseudoalteromonas ruthenica]